MSKKSGKKVETKKIVWDKVDDDDVRHAWQCDNPGCPEYEKDVFIEPWWYSDNGTPMCFDCDSDMVYVRTEINKEAKKS